MKTKTIEQSYARARYAEINVDTDAVLKRLAALLTGRRHGSPKSVTE